MQSTSPYWSPPPPLFPYYEAIHHQILDSEEIILYIEGQRCRLEE